LRPSRVDSGPYHPGLGHESVRLPDRGGTDARRRPPRPVAGLYHGSVAGCPRETGTDAAYGHIHALPGCGGEKETRRSGSAADALPVPAPSAYDLDTEPPPLWVAEITSQKSRLKDLESNISLYTGLGIPTYLAIDAITPGNRVREKFLLHLWQKKGNRDVEIQPDAEGLLTLPEMGVRLKAVGQRLIFTDAVTGEMLFDNTQSKLAARNERLRAENERKKAENERKKAENERKKAELAEKKSGASGRKTESFGDISGLKPNPAHQAAKLTGIGKSPSDLSIRPGGFNPNQSVHSNLAGLANPVKVLLQSDKQQILAGQTPDS